MKPVLLLGIGNTLRQDDGAGAAVAMRFQDHASIESLPVIQLLPEHIERFHGRRLILFVDSAVHCDQVSFQSLVAAGQQTRIVSGHVQHPRDLVCLYHWLYREWPLCSLVSLPAVDFGFGEQLSHVCRQGLEEAVRLIESHVSQMMSGLGLPEVGIV